MNDIQKKLYATFQAKYEAWATKPRPHAKNWTGESIIANPDYFHKFSTFRSREWEEYTQARDAFMKSLTGPVH